VGGDVSYPKRRERRWGGHVVDQSLNSQNEGIGIMKERGAERERKTKSRARINMRGPR